MWILDILLLILESTDWLINRIFFYIPSILRLFFISLIVLVIGEILDIKDKKKLKWVIYILYFIYSIYVFGFLINVLEFNALEWTAFITGIVMPFCMIIVGKWIANFRIKGWKILNYKVLWFIYLIICLIWHFIAPEEIYLGLAFFFWVISLLLIKHYSNLNPNSKLKARG